MELSVCAAGVHRVHTLGDDYTAGLLRDYHLLPEAYAAQRALQGEHSQLPAAHGALWSKCDPPCPPSHSHCIAGPSRRVAGSTQLLDTWEVKDL